MYEQAITQFGLDPAQTFYVDDLPANIATGKRLGFVSYQYDPQDHAPLHQALNAWVA
jgi:putative hydrolase of the HAD superfamily